MMMTISGHTKLTSHIVFVKIFFLTLDGGMIGREARVSRYFSIFYFEKLQLQCDKMLLNNNQTTTINN